MALYSYDQSDHSLEAPNLWRTLCQIQVFISFRHQGFSSHELTVLFLPWLCPFSNFFRTPKHMQTRRREPPSSKGCTGLQVQFYQQFWWNIATVGYFNNSFCGQSSTKMDEADDCRLPFKFLRVSGHASDHLI